MSTGGRVLALDIDSTIWDFPEWMCASLTSHLGYEVKPSDVSSWEFFYELPEREVGESFAEALDPERVDERSFYPGCPEVLRYLLKRDIKLAFITCGPPGASAREMEAPLARWLRGALWEAVDVEDATAQVSLRVLGSKDSKMTALREAGAEGLVDDKPATLEEATEAGLWAATLRHPYNASLLDGRPDIHGFDGWHEFPALAEKFLRFSASARR